MNQRTSAKLEVRKKMRDLFQTLIRDDNLDKLFRGHKAHMTLKLRGEFEIWFEEKKEDKSNPLGYKGE